LQGGSLRPRGLGRAASPNSPCRLAVVGQTCPPPAIPAWDDGWIVSLIRILLATRHVGYGDRVLFRGRDRHSLGDTAFACRHHMVNTSRRRATRTIHPSRWYRRSSGSTNARRADPTGCMSVPTPCASSSSRPRSPAQSDAVSHQRRRVLPLLPPVRSAAG
jgi:hypothetical protein